MYSTVFKPGLFKTVPSQVPSSCTDMVAVAEDIKLYCTVVVRTYRLFNLQ